MKHYDKVETNRGMGLVCPQRGCGLKFIVDYPKILETKAAAHVTTITCPCCSKVSRIPAEDLTPEHTLHLRDEDLRS